MKRVLKSILIISLCLGLGFAIGYAFGKLFGGNPTDHAQAEAGAAWKDITLFVAISIVSVFAGGFLQVVAHEAGHLVCGLISGYKFVSFRVLNFTLLKEDNKFKVKEFSLSGTGGQCLLCPPDRPVEKIPTILYELGGVLFNLLLSAICIAIAKWCSHNEYFSLALFITACIGVIMALLNGIPMKLSGFPNDGYGALHLKGDLRAKSALLNILRANALVQGGTRPAELSSELFSQLNDADLSNCLEANLAVLYVSVLIDNGYASEAMNLCRRIIEESTVDMLKTEAKVDFACLLFNEGKTDEAMGLFDEKELNMIERSAKTQSSKQRFLFMRALKAENDRQKALDIFEHVQTNKDKYLLQGEVAMDLDLMWKALKE